MTETAPLIFEKRLGLLAPVNPAAADALRAIDGRVTIKITRANRNQSRRALYWVVAGIVTQALNDALGMSLTENELHDITRKKLGLFDTIQLPSGDVYYRYHSTSDRAMLESDRSKFTDRAFRLWSNWLQVPVETLVAEASGGAA